MMSEIDLRIDPSILSKFCCKKATLYPSIHQNLFILIHNSSRMDPIVPVGLALRLKNISTALHMLETGVVAGIKQPRNMVIILP
jgi:hypothetical protein